MLAYLIREHDKTSQTRKIIKIITKKTKKRTGALKNVMQDQKGCKKNNIRAEEEQITARAKQHEDEYAAILRANAPIELSAPGRYFQRKQAKYGVNAPCQKKIEKRPGHSKRPPPLSFGGG